jgi:hypothetical protein
MFAKSTLLILSSATSAFAAAASAPQSPSVPAQPECSYSTPRSERCCLDAKSGMSVSVDALYWTVREESLAYAVVNHNSNPALFSDSTNGHGHIQHFKFHWDPGFRVALGWDTGYDEWDLIAKWTWYRNKTSNSIHAETNPNSDGIVATWAAGVMGGGGGNFPKTFNAGKAEGHYTLLANLFDLELSRDLSLSRRLILHPILGVRGGELDQKFSVFYTDPPGGQPNSLIPGHYRGECKIWGVGPSLGLNSKWLIPADFHLFGNLSGALLMGKGHTKATQEINSFGQPISGLFMSEPDIWTMLPNLHAFVGFGWDHCFKGSSILLNFDLGWEVSHFWSVSPFGIPTLGIREVLIPSSSLTMGGGTAHLRLDF